MAEDNQRLITHTPPKEPKKTAQAQQPLRPKK